jgi:predicted TIM-barrel fold metal-dependent hydrolase
LIIDCHYHPHEALLSIEELLQKMDASGVDKTALMGVQIGPFPEPSRTLVALLQFLLIHRPLRRLGRRFISDFTAQGIRIGGQELPMNKDPDNDHVFRLVSRFPDRFLGWVFVNPRGKKDPLAELERFKDMPGFVGVKAHPFWNRHTPLELAPVAERLAETGKPMIIHAGYDEEGDFEALLGEVPKLNLILAHAGFPLYHDTWRAIRDRRNVFVDLSQTSYVGEKTLKQVVTYLGVERCLFGTDGPFGFHGADGRFDYGLIKNRIERLFPDKGIQRRLLGLNFAELAGIPEAKEKP